MMTRKGGAQPHAPEADIPTEGHGRLIETRRPGLDWHDLWAIDIGHGIKPVDHTQFGFFTVHIPQADPDHMKALDYPAKGSIYRCMNAAHAPGYTWNGLFGDPVPLPPYHGAVAAAPMMPAAGVTYRSASEPATGARPADVAPTHPGAILRNIVLPAIAESKVKVAELLGVSRRALYDLIEEKQGVTPAMALRLGKLFGNGAKVWLNMQNTYDLWHAEREMKAQLDAIPTIEAREDDAA